MWTQEQRGRKITSTARFIYFLQKDERIGAKDHEKQTTKSDIGYGITEVDMAELCGNQYYINGTKQILDDELRQ